MPYSLKWTERGLFLTLVLAFFFKLFYPFLEVPHAFSSFLFKVTVALFCLLYLLWPWTVVPPEGKDGRRDRTLHFLAPSLWTWTFLGIFVARTWIPVMEMQYVRLPFNLVHWLLTLKVIILSIDRIHRASSKASTPYYGWILGRTFLMNLLGHIVIGTVIPGT